MRRTNRLSFAIAPFALVLMSGCMVGPNYTRPSVPIAPGYKESPPTSFKENDGWKVSQPSDAQLKGNWWEIFGDPQLDALEEKVDGANQTLNMADANYRAARANVGYY